MAANMSRREILAKVHKMVPPMLEKFHKGTLHVSVEYGAIVSTHRSWQDNSDESR